ncbi:MAG: GNAT family N-acetyltransferase [Actinophytocola sp.]|uniref:GNAT family N-acetyltransferase n=1 Tax=Actinophytocola sp. TaxID=1872138 RepID=UPI003C764ED2
MTARLVLRPFTLDDVDRVHDYQRLPEVARHLLWEPRDREQTRTAVEQMATETTLDGENDCLCLAVVRGDVAIGQVELVRRGPEHGELGYIFHPDHHGKGFATEAAMALLHLGFDLGMTEIIGRCSARNDASVHLLRRLGMRQTAADRVFVKGEWRDALTFSVTRTDEPR